MTASTPFQDRPLLQAAALLTLLLSIRIVHCLHPDAMALLTFKSMIGASFLTSWDPDIDVCTSWQGIRCDESSRASWLTLSPCSWPPTPKIEGSLEEATSLGDISELVAVDLSCNGFTGSFPSVITKLTKLSMLRLRNNNHLEGSLPKYILTMPNLETLDLCNTNLQGSLPTKVGPIWSPLKHLDLSYNGLTPDIPEEYSALSGLWYLNLRANRLESSGTPIALLSMTRLTSLDISDNLFSGELLSGLGLKLPSIMHLAAGNNQLSGSIPDSLTLLTALTFLDLGYNELSASLPSSLLSLPRLAEARLRHNSLAGSFPTGTAASTKLTFLDISWNELRGSLPTLIASSTKLSFLDLSHNQFTGAIRPEWSSLVSLRHINLGFNDLTGLIPTAFRALTNLDAFYAPHNRLSGPGLGAFAARGDRDTRFFLDLSYNHLSTDNLRTFATLFNFMDVNLSHNDLRGSIPSRMFQDVSMYMLDMSYNNLKGGLDEFMALTNLLTLNLAKNRLSGTIPAKISDLAQLQRLVLARNALSGSLPEAVTASNGLMKLDLSSNRLAGKLPSINNCPKELILANNGFTDDLPSMDSCAGVVERMDLSYNQLSGAIPTIVAEFSFLTHLSLSHNALNDTIPEGIADLRSLRVLDLSWNKLQGTIPAMLGLSEALQEVYLAGNQLDGTIPDTMATYPDSSFLPGNELLCGEPVKQCEGALMVK
ncbi:unnamed protein product [Closterium sp. NIES-53]